MSRPLRLLVPDYPHHVVQRGHNLNAVFVAPADYEYYLANLREWKLAYDVKVYAYCLMTNHVHLVLMPRGTGDTISALMKRLSARQTRHVNRLESRRGTLWCGRFASSIIDTDGYLLACLRYVELNPVRAGIVADPAEYRWSSFAERIGQSAPDLLDADPVTTSLGATVSARREAYQRFAGLAPDVGELALIRNSVRRNQLTGEGRFIDEIHRRTGLRVEGRAPGRPTRENKSDTY